MGISGTKEKRPELDRLMSEAHRRCFDAVIVWKFDRFARSVSHLLRALETFQALGIHFVSLSESLDTSTPTGKMVFTVLGAVAELDRTLIVERVRAGMRNAKAKGRAIGRPRADVAFSAVTRLRDGGASWRTIGRKLGISARTAKRLWGKRLSRRRLEVAWIQRRLERFSVRQKELFVGASSGRSGLKGARFRWRLESEIFIASPCTVPKLEKKGF